MNIHEWLEKIKCYFWIAFITAIFLVLSALWPLWSLYSRKTDVYIENVPRSALEQAETDKVIGSKTGHSYYYPWCGALARIQPKNRVVFANSDIAKARGYHPAKNCKGVQ